MFVLRNIKTFSPRPTRNVCSTVFFSSKTSGSDWTHWWGTSSVGSTLVVGRLRKLWKVGIGGSVFRAWQELAKCIKWCENVRNINIYITCHMIISRYYVCISWMAPNHYQTGPKKMHLFWGKFAGQLTGSMLSNGFCENTMDTRKWHFGFQNGKGNSFQI